jgi:hypothetical protein
MNTETTPTHAPNPARKRVAVVAHGMLSGEVSFLAGATELAALRHEICSQENDPDFQIFAAIAAQMGKGLSPAQAPLEPDSSIVWEKQMGITACQALVRRFHD